jgi:hypothetical protein
VSETKIGRPSKRTPELIDEICIRIASGRSLLSVSKDEDMPDHATIWRWMHAEEDFRDKYARAIQTRAINHAEEISETIQQVKRGELPPDVGRVVVDGMKWVASRLLPKVYGDKQIVEANVTHTHQLHLDALRALSARRSGNDVGYIEGQVIDITGDPTFSGERQDQNRSHVNSTHVNDLAQIGSPDASLGLDPPGGGLVPGAGLAPPTATRTRKKRSDPPPPPPGTPKRRPAKKPKNEK